MPGLVAIPDAHFFVKAQQTSDFHHILSAPGLRLRVLIPRPVFWELDELRFKQDMAFTVREVRRRLEQQLRTQQEGGALVTYETDLETRLPRDQKADEQIVTYLVQRARRFPRDRFVLLSDDVGVRNFALLSPDFQQLHNVHVSSVEEWAHAADWLVAQAEPGDVTGWAVRVAPNVMQDVDGERLQGLNISIACDILDFAFSDAIIKVWFQDPTTEVWLQDRNGKYQTGGYVSLSDRVAVRSDRERYEKTFFLPYDELHLGTGSHLVALAANLLNPYTGRQVGESAWVEFDHVERLPAVTLHGVTIQPAAITRAEDTHQQGLEIVGNFTIDSWRGRQGELRAYFRDQETGAQLMDRNGLYTCDGNLVCAAETWVPSREHAHFRRLSAFIPYDELHLPDRSAHRLECVVTLWTTGFRRELAESEWIPLTVGETDAEA